MNLTDTHCHLDLEAFDNDRQPVIDQAVKSGVKRILIPALNGESSHKVTSLSVSDPKLFAAIGYHPTEASKWEIHSAIQLKKIYLETLKTLVDPSEQANALIEGINLQSADHDKYNQTKYIPIRKIVAIGEIGLDYYWNKTPHELQKAVLQQQLDLARELNLPVILHSREKNDAEQGDCIDDLLGILIKWIRGLHEASKNRAHSPGVLHSFSGSLEAARLAIEMNFMIGVSGSITHRKANPRREIIAALPLERLLIETDAPFQSPAPLRGKRNEPAFVRYIADKIAEIHMTTPERVADMTTDNAARLFGWGG